MDEELSAPMQARAGQAIPVQGQALVESQPLVGRSVPGVVSVGGIMEMRSLSQQLEDERAKAEKDAEKPIIAGLAGHILSLIHI